MRTVGWLAVLAACGMDTDVRVAPMPAPVADAGPRLADPPDTDAPSVTVNELMASNRGAFGIGLDPVYPDWIELHNAASDPVALDGWTVSDAVDGDGSPLDGLAVPAHGFLLLFADDDPASGPDHLAFKLSSDGEEVVLRDPSGRIADHVVFGAQEADIAVARRRDGDESAGWTYRVGGTPGRSNTGP